MTESEFNKKLKAVTTPLPGSIPYRNIYTFSIKMKHDGWTLIDYLTDILSLIPREKWLEKINSGNLKVSNKAATPEMIMVSGYRLSHTSDEKTDPAVSTEIQLVHDDKDFIVINKPAPLPMHPCGRFNKNTLINFLNMIYPGIDLKITHRIDANTTGVVSPIQVDVSKVHSRFDIGQDVIQVLTQ